MEIIFFFSLTRVRHKVSQPKCPSTVSLNTNNSKNLVLFEDYAALEDINVNQFKLIRIQRMINNANKRRIEYKEPVRFEDPCLPNLQLLCNCYEEKPEGYFLSTTTIMTVKGNEVLCHVNLEFDEINRLYGLPEHEKEEIEKTISMLVARKDQNKQRVTRTEHQHSSFSGTFSETIEPRTSNNGDRRSTRRRTVTHHLH